MASGTLANLASSGFVRTPSECALSIAQQLLQLPQHFIAYDPTAGEGDLLVPFAAYPGAQLLGVEISADRVAVAKQRLPQAHIVTSAVEQTRLPGASVDLVLANPPYYFVNGVRAEYRVIKEAGESLRPGGIMVAIIPARSGWDKRLITHMGLWYDQIQCWKFPPATGNDDAGDFAHYTQIVVVGVRRRIRRDAVEEAEMTRLGGWRWKIKTQDFVQGFPPPALPNVALAMPYVVPESHGPAPVITLISPDDAMIADAVHQSGVHHLPAWRSATSWREDAPVPLSVMPILGEAHLAAEILTGLLDNQLVMSPEGVMHLFATCVTSQQVTVPVDEEELLRQRSRGVINLQIIERRDLLILTVLNLATGDLTVYQGEAAMTFLSPWLATLSEQALAQRIPRYALDPADWEIAIACRIGLDKQLPNTDYPGLVAPQLHRTFAMARALDQMGRVAIQGEPGCGKTRMAIALIARQAYLWHHPSVLAGHKLPRWMNRLGRAWRNTPRTAALLATAQRTRPTYPALVVTPRRVIKTWEAETVASWKEMEPPWEDELVQHWPEAEVVHIHSQQDVQRWMERCAVSEAPAVIGIVPHSLSRAFGQEWVPALITQPTMTVQERSGGVPSLPVYSASGCPIGYRQQQLALDCPKAVAAQYEAVNQDDGKLIGYRHRTTGVWLTEDVPRFRCPACGTRISSTGNRLPFADADEPMEEIPVTDRIWFTQHQRTCTYQAPKMKHPCGSPLWTRTRVEAVRAKYPTLSYADWQQAVSSAPSSWDTPAPVTAKTGRIITADRAHGAMAPDSWSPFDYLYQFFRGCVGVTIIDESHNMRNAGTDIGHALHLGQLSAQGYVYASGTHYGGCLDDFFYYWFRFDPEFWRRLGLEWTQCEDAVQRYGVIQTLIKEHEASSNKGTGETSTSMTKVVAPGISTRLIPHLLTNIAFLGIIDVGLFMPPRIEIPCIISLIDPLIATEQTALRSEKIAVDRERQEIELRCEAEPDAASGEQRRLAELDQRKDEIISRLQWLDDRDLSGAYQQLTTTLTDLIKDGNRAASLAEGTIPRWFVCCPMDKPFVVIQTVRNTWGRVESTKELVRTRQLAEDFVYPLERELQARVSGQIAEGRRVMVYIEQTQIRRLHTRLAWVLAEQNPWCLPGNTDAEDREQAIRDAVHRGHQVVIVPYRSVAEGINLQDCIDTIAFYEMPMNLFYLDQAGRRAWRLGKVLAVLILYFAYSGTQVYRKLWKLGNQSGAASAFAGEPARGALVERVGGDQSLIHQFSRNLARGRTAPDEIAELTDAFARRAEELQTVLKTGRVWIGLTDTLPERLAQAHQRRLIDSTACATRVVDADVIPVSLPTVPERGPHVMSIAAPIEERRHPNVPMTLDILHAWEAGRWPAVDCPPTVTNLLQRTLRAVVEYIGIECLAQRLPSREDLLDCFQQEFQYVQADVLSAVSWSQVAERATALCDLFHEQMVPKFHPIELISEEAVTLPNSSVPFVATPVAMTEPLRQGVRCRTLLDVVYTEDPDCWSERAVEQMDLPTAYLLVDRLRHADVTEMAQRVTFLVCIGDPVNRSSVRLEMRTTTRDAAQRKAFGLRLLDAAMAMNVSLAGSSTEVTSDERAAPAIDLPLVTRAARPTGTGESRSGATEEQSGLHDDVVEVPATLPTTDARPVVPASPTLPTTERFSMGDAECLLNPPETVMTGGSSERENLPVPVPVPTAYMRRMHLQVFPLEDTTLVQLVIEDQSDRSVTRIVRTTDEERLANLVAELQTYLNDHLEMWITEQPAPIVLPVAPKPVAPKPVAAKPVAAKPVAAKPVAAKPVAAKPVAPQHPPQSVPTAYRSAVEQPTLL